jgi:hypothetical protein
VGEETNLEAFISHQAVDWKIPLYQQVLDWLSGLAFAAAMCALVVFAGARVISNARRRKNASP